MRVLTGLRLQPREAYLHVAQDRGFFREAGIDVEIVPGNGTADNLTLLQEGQADIATLDVSAAYAEFAAGTYSDFVLTSVLHDQLLACIMVLASSPIQHPRQLRGASIAIIPGGTNTMLFPRFAERAGFDPDTTEQVPLPPPTFGQALGAGQVDAIMQFTVGQSAIEAAAGQPVRVFPYADQMPDPYGSALACSRRMANDDPELVRRFNTAALRGLQYTVDNPAEAARIFAAAVEATSPEDALGEIAVLADYVRPGVQGGRTLPLGQFSAERLEQTVATLQSIGALPEGFDYRQCTALDLV